MVILGVQDQLRSLDACMIVLNLYMLDTQIHAECISGCQQPHH